MAATFQTERPQDVANKVLRRAQVSKMTRALQDRLALANVKIQNGWENMSLDAIEPQVEERMKKKRTASSVDTISDTASTTSSRLHSSSGFGSSPLTAPMFSDELRSGGSVKRLRPLNLNSFASSGAATGRRNRFSARGQQTWKKNHDLPESSPIKHTKHAHFASNNIQSLSFISEASTVPDDPPSPEFSEDDDADLPVHSFRLNPATRIASSPPRTPPPERRLQKQNISWSRTPKTNDEGADLLVYLANSPSAGNSRTIRAAHAQPPSTPPCKSTPLPSSHMTPGTSGSAFFGFGPQTPSTNFNFADFVNVTPSPAQAPWTRTPLAGRTPSTATARRKLNFDTLMPPTSSPNMVRQNKGEGSGMELGGELR
ncbi:hypothetical protein WHR41_04238 [Cladosporium halotolerans]|uniref:Uncharacterized protein n=1 Tax=Cladosporium halotolerans TaxID=1052096 RepID=A0AB34KR26_9PEZI